MQGKVAGNYGCGEEAAGEPLSELGCALEMCGEKKPLGSELGCADGCGRQLGGENCADGCGRRGCQGVAGNGWGEEAMGMRELGCADGCGRERGAENCADGCGRRGCKGGWKCLGRRSRW